MIDVNAARPDLTGVPVAVLGLGVSGRAAAKLLNQAGAEVFLVDDQVRRKGVSRGRNFKVERVELVIASPGWPPDAAPLPAAQRLKRPVWSEVELAWRWRARPAVPWLGVTGTNGKTTTVSMLGQILRAAGREVCVAGNIGQPLVEAAQDPAFDVFVCELSSFQLHFTQTLALRAAGLLNLAPDHLDWHASMGQYAQDKARIFDRAGAIVTGPERALEILARSAAVAPEVPRAGLSLTRPGTGQLGVDQGWLVDQAWSADPLPLVKLTDLVNLTNSIGRIDDHLVLDALAASALARAIDIQPDAIRDGLAGFELGQHRGQVVGRVAEVTFVDDSKATNADAAAASFSRYGPGQVIWIAGGLAKGASYEALIERIAPTLAGVVLIGIDQQPWLEALGRYASQVPTVCLPPNQTEAVMPQAVTAAAVLAVAGQTVLLAPAAASMDQFTDYAARGQAFAQAVRALEVQGK